MFRLDELMKFKQEHPIIEEAHENIPKPEDAEWGWLGVQPPPCTKILIILLFLKYLVDLDWTWRYLKT